MQVILIILPRLDEMGKENDMVSPFVGLGCLNLQHNENPICH
jgi:hypothetical protein